MQAECIFKLNPRILQLLDTRRHSFLKSSEGIIQSLNNRIRRDGFQLLRIHADGRMTFKFQGGKTLTSY